MPKSSQKSVGFTVKNTVSDNCLDNKGRVITNKQGEVEYTQNILLFANTSGVSFPSEITTDVIQQIIDESGSRATLADVDVYRAELDKGQVVSHSSSSDEERPYSYCKYRPTIQPVEVDIPGLTVA